MAGQQKYSSRDIQEMLRIRRQQEGKGRRLRFWLFLFLTCLIFGGLGWFVWNYQQGTLPDSVQTFLGHNTEQAESEE